MKRYLTTLIYIVLITSCTPKAELDGFDTARWKADIKGCNGDRAELFDDLQEIRRNLLGLYQKTVIKHLGPPEEQELYKRSMNYYVYYIDPSNKCEKGLNEPRYLEIRFTSLGIANEVNIK